MYDPKHLELKKHLLTSLKNEGRQRHAMRLKHKFGPPEPPPPHEDALSPDEQGVDLEKAPVPPGVDGVDSGGAPEGELTKEKLIELLSRLG